MIISNKNSKYFPRPITYSTIEHKLPKQLDKIKLILFSLLKNLKYIFSYNHLT